MSSPANSSVPDPQSPNKVDESISARITRLEADLRAAYWERRGVVDENGTRWCRWCGRRPAALPTDRCSPCKRSPY